MKKYYIYLTGFNILSLFFIIQIKLRLIPYFPSKFNLSFINGLNETVVNLSYSIIASTLFYLIVVYLPEKSRKNKVQKIVDVKLKILIQDLYIALYYLLKGKASSKTKFEDFSEEEIKSITNLETINKINFSFIYVGEKNIETLSNQTELEYFSSIKIQTIKTIDEVFLLPFNNLLDEKLLLGLSKLRASQLFKDIDFINPYPIENFTVHIMDFYKIFRELSSCCPDFKRILKV